MAFEISAYFSRISAIFRKRQNNSSFENSKKIRFVRNIAHFRRFSKLFVEIRRDSSKFVLITFAQYCMFSLKVHMKPNLFLHSCKIYHLKCKIPKFEMARTKIDDFKSAESWAILP